jgi:hypothetical protein
MNVKRFLTNPAPIWAIILAVLIAGPVSAASAVIFFGSIQFPAYSTGNPPSTAVSMFNDNAAINGLWLNVPASSSNGYTFHVGGSQVAQINASGQGLFQGVNVGGALTGATNGTFANTVSANAISANGSVIGGVTLNANTVSAPSTISANYFLAANAQGIGYSDAAAGAGCNAYLGAGGGSVAGVTSTAFYVYSPCSGLQQAAMDNVGDLGIAGAFYSATGFNSNGGFTPPVYNTSGAAFNGSGSTACTGPVHIVVGQIAQSSGTVNVSLSGAAAFTAGSSQATYSVSDSIDAAGGGNEPAGYVTLTSGSSFAIVNSGSFGINHFIAVGC